MTLNIWHIIGIIVTFFLIIFAGYWSGRKIKNADDFCKGGDSGAIIIAGAIMGTLVGGSSTVGTAQLAFNYGMSAWWFTLGGGISCFFLAIVYAKKIYKNRDLGTLPGMISNEYGNKAGMMASVLSSFGIFLNLLAQLVAAQALIAVLFPNLNIIISTIIAAGLMICYVIFGGVLAAGFVGVIKLILLYVAVLIGGVLAYSMVGGIGELWTNLPHDTYFSLIARGAGKDLGAAVSLLFGVISTQTYTQAVISGKNSKSAVKGALISAFLIPPIGIGGILIGMYMKLNFPDIVSSQAFPLFIMNNVPSLMAGIIIATLLIAVVGTGAGLSLGMSSIINNDLLKVFFKSLEDTKKYLFSNRLVIFIIFIIGTILTTIGLGDTILNYAFLSMGLRAAVVFIPITGALFLKGKIASAWIKVAIIGGPVIVILGNIIKTQIDPLFIGLGFALLCALAGIVNKKIVSKKI